MLPGDGTTRACQENATARVQPRQFDACHRKGIWGNVDALNGDTVYGIPRGPGTPIAVVSRPPKACPEGNRAAGCRGIAVAVPCSSKHCYGISSDIVLQWEGNVPNRIVM